MAGSCCKELVPHADRVARGSTVRRFNPTSYFHAERLMLNYFKSHWLEHRLSVEVIEATGRRHGGDAARVLNGRSEPRPTYRPSDPISALRSRDLINLRSPPGALAADCHSGAIGPRRRGDRVMRRESYRGAWTESTVWPPSPASPA